MLCSLAFSHAEKPQKIDCSAPRRVCDINAGVIALPKAKPANLLDFLHTIPFVQRVKQESRDHF